jgi:hypothetical protein
MTIAITALRLLVIFSLMFLTLKLLDMIDCNMWLLDYLFCSLNSSTLQLLLDMIIDAERIGTAGARRSEKANVCDCKQWNSEKN